MAAAAVAGCAAIAALYTGSCAIWWRLPRSHPTTIKRRAASVVATCAVAWLPLRWQLGVRGRRRRRPPADCRPPARLRAAPPLWRPR